MARSAPSRYGGSLNVGCLQVCRSLLEPEEQSAYYWGVRRLVRYYLRGAQGLLDTVEHAGQLLRRLQQRSSRTHPVNAPDYRPHHRLADPAPELEATPTTSTAIAETTVSTTTEPVSTTAMVADWDDFFDKSPDWVVAMTSTAAPEVTYPPKTVIVHADDSLPSTGDDVTTPVTQTDLSTMEGASSTTPGRFRG